VRFPRTLWAGLAALLLGLALCASGCGGEMASPSSTAEGSPALAQLRRARSLHQFAARRAAAGDVDGAVKALEEVASLQFPAGAPEAADVAVDAMAEISRLLLVAGRAPEAEAAARRAVAAGSAPSYFVGLAWLRLGDALQARGLKRQAVDAFERSIAVNNAVLAPSAPAGPETR
jgi:tetratricopeptide (TPR) repeat protein